MSASRSGKRRKQDKLHHTGPRIPFCPVTSKKSYRSEKRAKTALNHNIANGGGAASVYKCGHCSNWHLTKRAAA